jgi:fumarylacetoacetase
VPSEDDDFLPAGRTWVPAAAGGLYDVDHLPYAVFSEAGSDPAEARVGARIGDFVVDLAPLAATDALEVAGLLAAPSLAPLMSAGPSTWATTRSWLQEMLTDPHERELVEPELHAVSEVHLHLPVQVADYVDFYCSEHHARRVGELLRPGQEPLPPQWRHLPVAYHGRAGSVVVSGTDVHRPYGQRRGSEGPVFAPTARLDFEAEVGWWVGTPTAPGTRLSTADVEAHVFGVSLVNDWSARDIQAWESMPLGPMLAKSFATSVAAWVTPLAALAAAKVALPEQHPEPLPHLRVDDPAGFELALEVSLAGSVVSRPPYASTYWSVGQMLAHLTSNGAALHTGDLFASGTVSGPGPEERGCLLELTFGGREPLTLADGSRRDFLADGDEVVITATAPSTGGGRLALGEVRGVVLPE